MRILLVVLATMVCMMNLGSIANAVEVTPIFTNDGVVYKGEFPETLEEADWKRSIGSNFEYLIRVDVPHLNVLNGSRVSILIENPNMPGTHEIEVEYTIRIDIPNRCVWVRFGDHDIEEGQLPEQDFFGTFYLSVPNVKRIKPE